MQRNFTQLSDLDLIEILAFAHEYRGHAIAEAMAEFERRDLNVEEHETLLRQVYHRRQERDHRNRRAMPYNRLIQWMERKLGRKYA